MFTLTLVLFPYNSWTFISRNQIVHFNLRTKHVGILMHVWDCYMACLFGCSFSCCCWNDRMHI